MTISLVALPLAPFLFRHHFLVLVLLRPGEGVLVAGGYLARVDRVSLLAVLVAAVPLRVLVVWLYYALGRAWSKEIDGDDKLPFVTAQMLQRERVRRLRQLIRSRGPILAALVRLGFVPVGLFAVAAGSSGLPPRQYLAADALAAVALTVVAIGAGYGLGVGYDEAGPWVPIVGAVGIIAVGAIVTSSLHRQRDEG